MSLLAQELYAAHARFWDPVTEPKDRRLWDELDEVTQAGWEKVADEALEWLHE